MNPPVNAREALLIEALGEMAEVLERADTVVCALDAARRGVFEANGRLAADLSTMERRMAALAEATKERVLHHLVDRTNQATRRSIDLHVKAMEEAARDLFSKELDPALRSLVQPLLRLQEVVRQNARIWDSWLTHAATAAAASLCTWLIASGFCKL